jgi:hypothetical protein
MATIMMGKGIAASSIMTAVAILASWSPPRPPTPSTRASKSPTPSPVSTAAVVVLSLAMIYYSRNRSVEAWSRATGGARSPVYPV